MVRRDLLLVTFFYINRNGAVCGRSFKKNLISERKENTHNICDEISLGFFRVLQNARIYF